MAVAACWSGGGGGGLYYDDSAATDEPAKLSSEDSERDVNILLVNSEDMWRHSPSFFRAQT